MDKKGRGFYEYLFGRSRYPPQVREWLKNNGNKQIIELKLYRAPIQSVVKSFLNMLTLGQIKRNIDMMHYDNIYHLALCITLDDNRKYLLEKNHVIQINECKEKGQFMYVYFNTYLNTNILLNNALKLYNNMEEMNNYDPVYNNCQRFILNLLEGSGLLTIENKTFILQDAEKLLENTGYIGTISRILTTVANRSDIIQKGSSLNYE